jgi:hypothetical protein
MLAPSGPVSLYRGDWELRNEAINKNESRLTAGGRLGGGGHSCNPSNNCLQR